MNSDASLHSAETGPDVDAGTAAAVPSVSTRGSQRSVLPPTPGDTQEEASVVLLFMKNRPETLLVVVPACGQRAHVSSLCGPTAECEDELTLALSPGFILVIQQRQLQVEPGCEADRSELLH